MLQFTFKDGKDAEVKTVVTMENVELKTLKDYISPDEYAEYAYSGFKVDYQAYGRNDIKDMVGRLERRGIKVHVEENVKVEKTDATLNAIKKAIKGKGPDAVLDALRKAGIDIPA